MFKSFFINLKFIKIRRFIQKEKSLIVEPRTTCFCFFIFFYLFVLFFFVLQFQKTTVIFEISTLERLKFQSFIQSRKSLELRKNHAKQKSSNLVPEILCLSMFGLYFS